MAKTKATQQTTPNSQTDDTSFLDEDSGQGYDGVNSKLPMLKILHFTDEEVTSERHKVGEFYNATSKRAYGRSIDLIVIKAQSAWLEWIPKSKGGGFKGKHPVGAFEVRGDFFDKDNPPMNAAGNEIQEVLELYCLDPENMDDGPFLFSVKGSSIRHGNNLLNAIRTKTLPSGKIPPIYGSVWRLTTKVNKKVVAGTPTQWYTFGEGKETNCEFVRWVTKDEFVDTIKPSVEFVKIASSLDNPVPASDVPLIEDKTDF